MSSSPAMAVEMSWVTSKACQRLLLLNAVTAKVRLMNKSHRNRFPDFLYIWSGRLRTVSLEDFLPSATRVPLSLLPLQEAAGWIDEASSSRLAAAHAVVGPPDGATTLMTFMEAVMMS